MSRAAAAAWGAAVSVLLAAVSAALINELHGGWPWWVAAGGVVLGSAALAAWLALRATGQGGDRLDAGAVKAARDIQGNVETHAISPDPPSFSADPTGGDQLGPGAVKAGRDIRGG